MASRRETTQAHRRPNRKGCVLWVVNLNVGYFGAMLRLLLRHGRLEVRYLRSTPAMSRLTKIFRLFGSRVGFHLVKHLNGAEPDAQGTAIYCRKEEIAAEWSAALSAVLKKIWQMMGMPGWILGDRCALYMEREAYDQLGEVPLFMALAEREALGDPLGKTNYLSVPRSLVFPQLAEFFSAYNLRPIQESALHGAIRNLRLVLRYLPPRLDLDFSKAKPSETTGLCKVAVQCAEGDDRQKRSDLFWWPDSGLAADRVVYFFTHWTRYQETNKPNILKWMDQIVALEKTASQHLQKPMWLSSSTGLAQRGFSETALLACKLLRNYGLPQIAWATNAAINFYKITRYWWNFLAEHKIGCDLSRGETWQTIKSKHVALDLRGGVQFSPQRSMFWMMPLGADFGLNHGHVLFLWGRDGAAIPAAGRNRLLYGVITGFIYDYTFKAARAKALGFRDELFSRGAQKIIALFDTNPATPAARPADVLHFYNRFLDWVEQDPALGVIAKPKKLLDPHLLPNLEERINEVAQKTGRFLLLSQYKQPAEAALGADFVVGIGFNSAVTEAAIAGVPAAYWDLLHIRNHHYHRWGDNKVVFDDLDQLVNSLRLWLKNKEAVPGMGDFSPIHDELDPFRDGKAHERVGEYIRWTLEYLTAGYERDKALQAANNRYAEKWGADKIIAMSAPPDSMNSPEGSPYH